MADSSVTVKVDGLRRLQRDLRAVGDDLADLKDTNAAVSQLVAAEARRRAPTGASGRLAASGRGNRAAGRATVLFGGARVPYAGPVHYGWPARGIEAQPFATDAATITEPAWLAMYVAGIDQVTGKLAGRDY